MSELTKLTVTQLSEMLEKGVISCTELTEAYINRIKSVEDKVGAFLTFTPEAALAAARHLSKNASPLNGIPYAAKDNICTKGIRTTCASKMLEGFIPCYSATVIDSLNEQGAILLGKTNMDEFGMGSSTESSAFHGTANPRNLSYVPGGSSGGSAAAVASDTAAFALGSDTGGSVRQPAAHCGVVGMKPTYGRVSRHGLVAFASSLDQIGVISKNVCDNATVLNQILTRDGNDLTHVSHQAEDLTALLNRGVKGLKIALPSELFDIKLSAPQIKDAVLHAAKVFERLGATVEYISIPHILYSLPAYYIISSAEASSNLSRYDGVRFGHRSEQLFSDTEGLYRLSRGEGFGDEVKRRIILGTFALSEGYRDRYYENAIKARNLIKHEINTAFKSFDILLCPVTPSLPQKRGHIYPSSTEPYESDIFTVFASLTGHPALSLPCAVTENGLPIGLQLIGQAYSESVLYQAANAFEAESGIAHPSLPSLNEGSGNV